VRGREIGVFEGWYVLLSEFFIYRYMKHYNRNRVAPLVVGVSGSSFHKVRTEAEGWARFEDAETDGQTYVIPP
jgi:hypothetical protein